MNPESNNFYAHFTTNQGKDRRGAIKFLENLIAHTDPDNYALMSLYNRDLSLNLARLPEQNPDNLKRAVVLGYEATKLAEYLVESNDFHINEIGEVQSRDDLYVIPAGDEQNIHTDTLERSRNLAAAMFITAMGHARLSINQDPEANNETGQEYLRGGCDILASTNLARELDGDTRVDQLDINWYARTRMVANTFAGDSRSPLNDIYDATLGTARALDMARKSEDPDHVYGASVGLTDQERRAAKKRAVGAALALEAFSLANLSGAQSVANSIARKAL